MNAKPLFFTFILLWITSLTFASSPLRSEGSKVMVSGSFFKSSMLTLKVMSLENEIIFEKIIVNSNQGRVINLEKLAAGNYIMELSDEMKIISTPVTVRRESIDLGADVMTYKPAIQQRGSQVALNFFNAGTDVTVNIVNSIGETLFTENFNDKNTIGRSYNLANLPGGKYVISIYSAGRYFEKQVSL